MSFIGTKKRNERGATLVLFTFLVISFLLPIVGLAIDGGIAFVVKAKLSAAVDAAALAGAQALGTGPDTATQSQNAVAAEVAYFNAGFPQGLMNATPTFVPQTPGAAVNEVRNVPVYARATFPTYFLRILGFPQVTVSAVSQASRRNVNLMLVLDRSGSMTKSGACEPMKAAAEDFASKFANQNDALGEISFMASANPDFPLNSNFNDPNSQTPNIIQTISSIQCPGANGGTGTAEALSIAKKQFNGLLQTGAYNIIVLFTDGNPDAVAATFPITNPACQPGVNPRFITGIVQNVNLHHSDGTVIPTPAGIYIDTGWPVSKSTDTLITSPGGCNFQMSIFNAYQDIGNMPAADFWGNSISGYAGSNPNDTRYAIQVREAALNAADNAAQSIRQSGIQIYAIGEGSQVDASASQFLNRVANVSPSNPGQPVGTYIYAPTPSQLASAFNTIALQILRLSH